MSAWSAIAAVAIALAVVVVGLGQPVWEWRRSDNVQTETWSYTLFRVTHTVANRTLGNTTVETFTFGNLPGQPRIAALFSTLQEMFYGLLASLAAAAALSVATLRRKLRGSFPGAALVIGCLLALFLPILLALDITAAANDLPSVNGNSLPAFQGQIVSSGGNLLLTWGPDIGWYLFLGLCILLAFGASEVWSVRVRKAVQATATDARGMNPPPPPAPVHAEPSIEEVFVIGSNGLLVKHMSRTLMSDKDRDVVGGMISVLSNFVRETFSERDGNDTQEVTLGDHRFILCTERGVVVAVLVTRGETEDIVPRIRHLLACLIDRYADKLDVWGGEPLEGIEDEIEVIWQPFFLPPPPAD